MAKVTVLGAGNGGCAAAVDLSIKGHDVALFDLYPKTLIKIQEQGGLYYEGAIGSGFCKISLITSDIGDALHNSDFIMMNVPGVGHEAYGNLLAPHLKEGDIVLMNPGHSGGALHLANVLKKAKVSKNIKICETNTLSYISRIVEPGRVMVSSYDKSVLLSVFPAMYKDECTNHIRKYYPNMVPVDTVLTTTMSNLNAIFHPPGVILNAGWIEHTKGNFRFYYDGITPSIGRLIEKLDQERLAVGNAFGLNLMDFPHLLYSVGSTSEQARDSKSAYRACHESEPNQFIMSPPSLDNRYMHEDINSGILPMSALAKLANIKTPVIDSLIIMACALMGKDYWTEGFNLEKMGLSGMDMTEVIRYLEVGHC